MRRMLGRRLVEVGESKITKVVVRCGFWRQDEYFSDEGDIVVTVNQGVLTIEHKAQHHLYNSRQWKTVTTEFVPTRAKI